MPGSNLSAYVRHFVSRNLITSKFRNIFENFNALNSRLLVETGIWTGAKNSFLSVENFHYTVIL